MKRAFYSAAALLAFLSCSVETPVITTEEVTLEKELITITASQEGAPQTRTVLDEDLIHVLWTPEDRINLFYQDQNACFTSINTFENTSVAQFQGQMYISVVTGGNEGGDLETSYFWGLYPYSEDAWYDMYNATVVTYLPDFQVAEKNTFADDLFITVGRSTSWNMPFYNVCSGLRFTVDQEGITSVILRSNNGEPLAGRFAVGFDSETEKPVIRDVYDQIHEVRLFPPDGSPYFYPDTYYYFVTLPGTLEGGLTLELDGLPYPAQVSTTSPVTFKRSRFISTQLTVDRYYSEYLPLQSIDLNIENKGVRGYMADVDYSYDLANYSDSFIMDYVSMGADKPEPVRFNWKTSDSRFLSIFDPDGDCVYSGDASDYTTEVYNLVPGKRYTYHVDVEGGLSWDSSFTPEGTLRMIGIDGIRNVRDLGGWKAGNKTIRYGKIYRGAQLNNITATGRDVLFNTLIVSADIDLRGTGGAPGTVNGGTNILGIGEYYNYGVSYFQITGQSGRLYADALRQIIRLLREGRVVYFHCMVGADRTGTLAFLIEALLGVSESDLSKDFELTSFFEQERRTRNGSVNSQFAFRNLISSMRSNYTGETIQDMAVSWAISNGLQVSEIEELRQLLLE